MTLTSGVCPKVTMHWDTELKVSFELEWDPTVIVFERKSSSIVVNLKPRSDFETGPYDEKWVQVRED